MNLKYEASLFHQVIVPGDCMKGIKVQAIASFFRSGLLMNSLPKQISQVTFQNILIILSIVPVI